MLRSLQQITRNPTSEIRNPLRHGLNSLTISTTAFTFSTGVRPGENLIVYAKGLGPTRPGVNPGDPFPDGPAFAAVTSPVEVLVNGTSSPAINQVGVPGTTDTYRIDFKVPDDTAAGAMTVQISAAWVKGAAVRIPLR